jgi:hypothetical protein
MSTPRCYTAKELPALLKMSRSTFFALRKRGALPFLEELKPRLGGQPRYRADLIDRYFENQHGQPRFFAAHRRAAS